MMRIHNTVKKETINIFHISTRSVIDQSKYSRKKSSKGAGSKVSVTSVRYLDLIQQKPVQEPNINKQQGTEDAFNEGLNDDLSDRSSLYTTPGPRAVHQSPHELSPDTSYTQSFIVSATQTGSTVTSEETYSLQQPRTETYTVQQPRNLNISVQPRTETYTVQQPRNETFSVQARSDIFSVQQPRTETFLQSTAETYTVHSRTEPFTSETRQSQPHLAATQTQGQ